MSDILSAQHPPAVKVGGRRLSVSSRPRARAASGGLPRNATDQAENTDYPRPTAQGAGEEQVHPPPHNEEEAPKKEKKHGHGSHDQSRLKESVYRKVEGTMPSKDHLTSEHCFGARGRVVQPTGRALDI
ncbi:hypothetical protein PAXRUDRAFT_824664 [Paxillus rubicundulus Ve08.2h10]|uniref:Uncharacterized protein n=1 Tax=Paxillus rubicundulus Ve08.2h10 TaxID=930991 RepID=A0A0D0EBJ0_9AGAM|nr:hypothetical protein PAXRUDRAFT_824664 [Paxillus rubicundulus Ve08.2h10]